MARDRWLERRDHNDKFLSGKRKSFRDRMEGGERRRFAVPLSLLGSRRRKRYS